MMQDSAIAAAIVRRPEQVTDTKIEGPLREDIVRIRRGGSSAQLAGELIIPKAEDAFIERLRGSGGRAHGRSEDVGGSTGDRPDRG